jgi:hypothetical protein
MSRWRKSTELRGLLRVRLGEFLVHEFYGTIPDALWSPARGMQAVNCRKWDRDGGVWCHLVKHRLHMGWMKKNRLEKKPERF